MPVPAEAPPTDAPRLSIVIVNWNTKDLLLALLGRLLPAPLPCEVIVVDNDSKDGSADAAAAAFPQAIVLRQPKNGGFAYGVNRGLERARGTWVLLFNTDAEAPWSEFERFLAAAERCPGAAVFGPRIVDEHGRAQQSAWQRTLPRHALREAFVPGGVAKGPMPTVASDVDVVSGCVFLIRGSVLRELGGLDERFWMYFEEADFCDRVRQAGHTVRWLPDATFLHVGGLSANLAAERTFLAYLESRILYHAAWHGRLATEWVRGWLLFGHLWRLVAWSGLALFGRRNRARLYRKAVALLGRPGLVAAACRRPREVPPLRALAN
ncbi:MAG: glycosyltransferase family 2 protein [Planctomycetes bacterium]|nr:glycosyltransferase family 2 protein [Planctomycetota bacterium]